jgi:peptidoglycan hydrolase-like protein with peptidoglycan-binding domain
MYKNIDITTKIKLTESDLKKTVKKVLKEDPAPLPNMENVSLGKVKAVQQALVNAGYYIGNTGDNEDGVDGIFGKNTRAAVIKYQGDNGIKQTGNVGTITSGKLGVSPLTSGNPSQPQNNGKVGDSNSQNTTYDKNYDYKKENGQYYYKLKSSDKWILSTGKNKDAIASKVFNSKEKSTTDNKTIVTKNDKVVPNDNIIKQKVIKDKDINQNIQISPTINPEIKNIINWDKISSKDTTMKVCHRDDINCAQFVNDFSDKFSAVGNAWNAYANDSLLGPTVYSAFKGLNKTQQNFMINTWLNIHKSGGGKKDGNYMKDINKFVNTLVPNLGQGFNDLKLDDVVGIYYPISHHHEEAFYQGGVGWFKDVNGKKIPGNTIKKGDGWGMNTHVGIVGAIKDGVPLIFHNIKGNVQTDPTNKLRIAWVKRK